MDSQIKEYTCIVCPRGCHLTARKVLENGREVVKVKGNFCPRGEKYATEEMTRPMRTVTSSAYVTGSDEKMVSVKTSDTVPKDSIAKVLEEIGILQVKAPVHVGDVLIENVAGTGRQIVATRNVDAKG